MGVDFIYEFERGNWEISENFSLKEADFLHVGLCYGRILCDFWFSGHGLGLEQYFTTGTYILLRYVGGQFCPSYLWNLFLRSMHQKIYKADALDLSERARDLITLHVDWYAREYFSYIHILGSNIVHLFLRIVSDQMVLQEIAYQTIVDGFFHMLPSSKRKSWPNFPLSFAFCTLQNSTHATILGSEFVDMNWGEAPRRMHDPKSYLASHFVQEHARIQYAHQDELDDSIYRAAIDFQ